MKIPIISNTINIDKFILLSILSLMNKILDFLKNNKYALIWTACYITLMWAILLGLFNFDIFSKAQWIRLAHAELRGFPGFVFGILMLAALPLYAATTAIIIRTKKPLFTIPLPKFLQPVAEEKKESEPEPEKKEEPEEEKDLLPQNLPAELRAPFLRARSTINRSYIKSNFDISNVTELQHKNKEAEKEAVLAVQPAGELPLPTDFNFENEDISEDSFSMPTFTPVFQDIDFDEEPKKEETIDKKISKKQDEIINLLIKQGQEVTIDDDLIITQNVIIAVHDDSDFWIADNEDWFAAGKRKTSPIKKLLEKTSANKQNPILYLAETNIMDLETRCTEWESQGIKIIKNISDLETI